MDLTMFGIGKPSLIGLDIGSSTVKAVEVSLKGKDKGFELKGLGVASLPPEAIVQGAFLNSGEIVDTIREAVDVGGFKTRDAAVAVSGHSVIVKKVSLPAMNREELVRIARAMRELPVDQQRILQIVALRGGTHAEAARQLQRSEGACRILLARARAALTVAIARGDGE